MKTSIILFALSALLATFSEAQQNPSSQLAEPQTLPKPASAQSQPAPCIPQALPKPLKVIHPPSRFQQLIDKQRKRIQQQTGIDAPSIDDLKKDAQKPCPPPSNAPTQAKAPAPKTNNVTAVSPAPATSGPTTKPVPTYVCPPKSTLIPGYPYCLLPDHSTVDAIPLPLQSKAPTSQPKQQ